MITKEMENWFQKRTEHHINLVQKYGMFFIEKKIAPYTLATKLITHDSSKLLSPEYRPYILITWKYKQDRDEFDFSKYEDEMYRATIHHVKTNKHHPEYWSNTSECINKNDRDKPFQLIDAIDMPFIYVIEMVCDWLAVSEERGTSVKDWVDNNIGVRWLFNKEQTKLIYFLIDEAMKI